MKHYTWESVPLEVMSEVISRKVISGQKAMVAQVFLKKDAVVPEHHHESEQITYILEGALKFMGHEDLLYRRGNADSESCICAYTEHKCSVMIWEKGNTTCPVQ